MLMGEGSSEPLSLRQCLWGVGFIAIGLFGGFLVVAGEVLQTLDDLSRTLGIMNAKLIDAWWQATTGPPRSRRETETPSQKPSSLPPGGPQQSGGR